MVLLIFACSTPNPPAGVRSGNGVEGVRTMALESFHTLAVDNMAMVVTVAPGDPSVDFHWHENLLDMARMPVHDGVLEPQTEGFFMAALVRKVARIRTPVLEELVVDSSERVTVENWSGPKALLTSSNGIGRTTVHGLMTKVARVRGVEHSKVVIEGLDVGLLELERTGNLSIVGHADRLVLKGAAQPWSAPSLAVDAAEITVGDGALQIMAHGPVVVVFSGKGVLRVPVDALVSGAACKPDADSAGALQVCASI